MVTCWLYLEPDATENKSSQSCLQDNPIALNVKVGTLRQQLDLGTHHKCHTFGSWNDQAESRCSLGTNAIHANGPGPGSNAASLSTLMFFLGSF